MVGSRSSSDISLSGSSAPTRERSATGHGATPSQHWMVSFRENPIKMDDFMENPYENGWFWGYPLWDWKPPRVDSNLKPWHGQCRDHRKSRHWCKHIDIMGTWWDLSAKKNLGSIAFGGCFLLTYRFSRPQQGLSQFPTLSSALAGRISGIFQHRSGPWFELRMAFDL